MVGTTSNPDDSRLTHGFDDEPRPQAEIYLVATEEERAKGFVRPYRDSYKHVNGENPCNGITRMGRAIAETYARNPNFYAGTYCVHCQMHLPLSEFVWMDGMLATTMAVGT